MALKESWFYCRDCRSFFPESEGASVKEYHSEIDGNFYETFLGCPYCESTDLEDAYECPICGEGTLSELCEDCKSQFFGDLDKFFEEQANEDDNLKETLKTLAVDHICD